MKKLFIAALILGMSVVSNGCKTSESKQGAVTAAQQDEDAVVRKVYLDFINAQRTCDRKKLQSLITPRTWAALTRTRTKSGDMVTLLCNRAHQGKVMFEDVSVNGDKALLSVKIGNQPPVDVNMVKINSKWMIGVPGKVKKEAIKAPVNVNVVRQMAMPRRHFKVTNLHIGPRLIPGAGGGNAKTIKKTDNTKKQDKTNSDKR